MSDQQKMTDVLSLIVGINDPKCLKTIHKTAFSRMREQRKVVASVETATWSVGDKLQISAEHRSRKPYGTVGVLKKINKVKMVVDFGQYGVYNVPKSMLVQVA